MLQKKGLIQYYSDLSDSNKLSVDENGKDEKWQLLNTIEKIIRKANEESSGGVTIKVQAVYPVSGEGFTDEEIVEQVKSSDDLNKFYSK